MSDKKEEIIEKLGRPLGKKFKEIQEKGELEIQLQSILISYTFNLHGQIKENFK